MKRSLVSIGVREMIGDVEQRAVHLALMRSHGVGEQWLVNGCNADGAGAGLYLFAKSEHR